MTEQTTIQEKKPFINMQGLNNWFEETFSTSQPVPHESHPTTHLTSTIPFPGRCKLCNLTKVTNWYHEDRDWIILDCKTCGRPMVVYRQHTMFIPPWELFQIFEVVRRLFGMHISFRMSQRRIKDHFHFHIYKGGERK